MTGARNELRPRSFEMSGSIRSTRDRSRARGIWSRSRCSSLIWRTRPTAVPRSGIDSNNSRPGEADVDIKRSGSQPSGKGPAEYFTGTVRLDPLFQCVDPARVAGAQVTFEPGARTAWHTHPLGQTLIVIAGFGLAQRWGGPIEDSRRGDT